MKDGQQAITAGKLNLVDLAVSSNLIQCLKLLIL